MRKSLLSISVLAALFAVNTSYAQISNGGIPLSKRNGVELNIKPTPLYFENPLASVEALNQARKENETARVMEVARFAGVDVSFPQSGVFEYLDNGEIVWRAQIVIPGAAGLGTYFDLFDLPKGVDMFMYNETGSQILGAFGIDNVVPEDTRFAVDAIQGNYINLELNIAKGVDLNQIKIHIDKVAVYYEGISFLAAYERQGEESRYLELDKFGLQGKGSPCMVNAACKSEYDVARKAAIQTLYPSDRGLGMCSAGLINRTGNTPADCKNYVLTASHCQSNEDGFGEYSNNAFTQTLFRFNFEVLECQSVNSASVNTMTGAYFLARTPYQRNDSFIGAPDFLLLQLRTQVPRSYDARLAGWDIPNTYPTLSGDKQYIGFHHPTGDIKKTSWNNRLTESGYRLTMSFAIDASRGSASQGSSGSSLFNPDGKIIGIASTAPSSTLRNCPLTSTALNYYNIKHGWEFGPNTNEQLKYWLDSYNKGVKTLNYTTTYCDDMTSVIEVESELDTKVNFYPNPTNSGVINVKFDFSEKQNLTLEVYNMLGSNVGSLSLDNIVNGNYPINLSDLSNGMYLIKVSNGVESVTKKITISK